MPIIDYVSLSSTSSYDKVHS